VQLAVIENDCKPNGSKTCFKISKRLTSFPGRKSSQHKARLVFLFDGGRLKQVCDAGGRKDTPQ
jgi:hypothetical protein